MHLISSLGSLCSGVSDIGWVMVANEYVHLRSRDRIPVLCELDDVKWGMRCGVGKIEIEEIGDTLGFTPKYSPYTKLQ